MVKHICICSILLLLCSYSSQAGDNLKISVYYEALCPDSINFITGQFFPVYKKISSPLKVDLVPYGFANGNNDTGKWEFTCQHGPKECFANKYHACAIALYSVEESAEFVDCSMSSTDPSSESVLNQCSTKSGIPWRALQTCYNSGQADKLLALNGVRTNAVRPAIKFIPTVVFDDVFNQTLQDEALYQFEKEVCKLLDYKPDACISSYVYKEDDIVLLKL